MRHFMEKRIGKPLASLHGRVAAAVVLLVVGGTAVLAAAATFIPIMHSGSNGNNYQFGNYYLYSANYPDQPVRSNSKGRIKIHTADWTTDAKDKGKWAGTITQAGQPRWEVTMKTIQPVVATANSGDPDALKWVPASHYYRAEAHHLGWGLVNDEVLVWDGAHIHIGNGETTLEEVRWHQVSLTQQIPYAFKRYAGGTENNISIDDDGAIVYVEQTMEFSALDDSLGIVVDLEQETFLARLTHRWYTTSVYGHDVWLRANDIAEASDEGWIATTVNAFDDSLPNPDLGSWVIQ